MLLAKTRFPPLSRRRLARHVSRFYATVGPPEQRDLVIVGGGPAGLALASALSQYAATNSIIAIYASLRFFQGHTRLSTRHTHRGRGFVEDKGLEYARGDVS